MSPEEQAVRQSISDLRSERLDAFRARIPTMRTSDILAYMNTSETLIAVFPLADDDLWNKAAEDTMQRELCAAVLALGDEIDRRIPVPSWLWECAYCGRRYPAGGEAERCGGRNLPTGTTCAKERA